MMNSSSKHFKRDGLNTPRSSKPSSLQTRMTLSYMWVTVSTAFVLQCLNVVLLTGTISYTLTHAQVLGGSTHFPSLATYPLQASLVMMILVLLVTPLLGGWFGTLTTQSMIKRIRHLVTATTQVADGNYTYQVDITQKDEIGQLEEQFNRMAEQLQENTAKREELATQNARFVERARISRELHDAISQDLFSLHMITGGLQTDIAADSPMYPQIMTLKQTTATMIREMRTLLLELRPTQLEQLGLVEALEDLAAAYRTRLGITVTTNISPIPLSSQAEHTFLRVAQEAFVNAARHADATTIKLDLIPLNTIAMLTITDNGNGFDVGASERQYGLGLHGMQERVRELNGTFELHTALGQGTKIHVCLPQEQSV